MDIGVHSSFTKTGAVCRCAAWNCVCCGPVFLLVYYVGCELWFVVYVGTTLRRGGQMLLHTNDILAFVYHASQSSSFIFICHRRLSLL